MNELSTLPTSIRERLEQAQSLSTQNRPDEARAVLTQAAVELSRIAPELGALIQAASFGAKGVVGHIRERTRTVERIEYRFFGFLVHEEWTPIEKVTEREIDLQLRW